MTLVNKKLLTIIWIISALEEEDPEEEDDPEEEEDPEEEDDLEEEEEEEDSEEFPIEV
ncbi:hypothetical protein FNV43_RR21698 [Rhamnella rubrinervis]|uniref:Uncharacterized protein n=1 Tax=Rhamnella rubrinervis TaxID=2594499 RepID=A0A8K0DUS2_9ROSA|nr:hypothetical protein FNV43_RR21698 [Rhamnella rubrinervis]